MAFSTKSLLSLVTLLVLATSQAHGLTISGVSVTVLTLNVRLRCQVDPAAIGSSSTPPLTDAVVTLLNNGQVIGSAGTDLDGSSTITINSGAVLSNILGLSNLSVRLGLPIASCPVFVNTNGALVGTVTQVGSITGGLLRLTVTTLRRVA